MRPFGFNVIGHVSANVGLGVVARNVIRLVLEKGHEVATMDIDPGRGRAGHDATYSHLAVASAADLPYGVSLVVLSITALPDILTNKRVPLRGDVVNAGFFWWELPVIHDIWARSLEQFDVLIAGSQFLRSTFERQVSGIPAIHALHAIPDFGSVRSARDKFEIPSGKTIFMCIVEPTSDPVRKNPYGAIAAFRAAFDTNDPAHLVIKLNNAQAAGHRDLLGPLREAIANLGSRVTLIEKVLPHRDVIELFASCDVFVGLHRAEGLGLGLMEAMALGKPVVATGWSGNMTFMNHANSCLVGYRLVPVAGSIAAYAPTSLGQEVHWAEPNIADASAWMRALADQPALRQSIGSRAIEDINRYRQDAQRGQFVDELHAIWERAHSRQDRNDRDVEEALKNLRQAQSDTGASPMERARRKSRRLLDRHILWRLRSR